jgi:CheY-like chemotaxis protein
MADVLIVDDDSNNRLLLATLLRHAGHTPHEASSGKEAAAMAQQAPPALIIVDLALPDVSGVELMRQLRSDARTRNTKLALYTATQPGAALSELADIYAISAVIPKPGDPRAILQLLEGLLAP